MNIHKHDDRKVETLNLPQFDTLWVAPEPTVKFWVNYGKSHENFLSLFSKLKRNFLEFISYVMRHLISSKHPSTSSCCYDEENYDFSDFSENVMEFWKGKWKEECCLCCGDVYNYIFNLN